MAITDDDAMAERPRGRRRGRRIVAVVSALLALALALLWSQRKPIATGFVDRALTARGVPARYRIARFGVYEQRLEGLSLGDPGAPDLTAEWVELRLAMGLRGPEVRRVRAHGVRLRGRLVDGRVSFGAVDRLLPASSGGPFALPALDVDLSDARMRLDTPYGPLGLAVDGRGKLSDGFRGTIAVASRTLAFGGCAVRGATLFAKVSIAERRATLDGPLRADRVVCGAAAAERASAGIHARLAPAFDRWEGDARLAVDRIAGAGARGEQVRGSIGFAGTASRTEGRVQLATARVVRGEALATGRDV